MVKRHETWGGKNNIIDFVSLWISKNMGAYFRCYKKGKFIKKTLIVKKNGSLYPNINDFNKKIFLLKKHLGEFIADTKINYDGKRIRAIQPLILGEDIFVFLENNKKKPRKFGQFIQALTNLYQETGMLPDLVNKRNVLITINNKIIIIDVWSLFYMERTKTGDLSKQSYNENLQKFEFLKGN